MRVLLGVDIGQRQDPTALVRLTVDDPQAPYRVACHTLPLGTAYPAVVEQVARHAAGADRVLMDLCGVGRPVFDLLRPRVPQLIGVLTHGGRRGALSGDVFSVPKRFAVTAARAALRHGLILEEGGDALGHELRRFGKDGRMEGDGAHDDLVMAFALACLGLALEERGNA